MMPSATELNYFMEIAATENISRASERLGIAQPTLSVAIKRLEAQVGTALLVRSKTGVKLTKAGWRFQTKARVLLEHWQTVLQSIKRDEAEIAGCYTIGAHVSVACNRLAQVLPKLLERNPSLELHMHHDLSRKITERVINFELDFGVVVNPVAHPDLVIRKLYEDEVGFFSASEIASTEDACQKILCYDPDCLQGPWLLKKALEAGISFSRTLVSSSLEMIADVCSRGTGIAILPKRVADAARRPLVPVLTQLPTYKDTHALVCRADVHVTAAAKALARSLEKELKDESGEG
jgi:DNA-binding transcriptional LysR family regulator